MGNVKTMVWILFSSTLPSVLFQTHHVTYHALPISYSLNKKNYHPILIHTWDLLNLVFNHKRNTHSVYSLKVISLKNKISKKFSVVLKKYCWYDHYITKYLWCDIQLLLALYGNIWFCFTNSFCSWPTIQRSRCTFSCGNLWEAQSHAQTSCGIFRYWQEFFTSLVTG